MTLMNSHYKCDQEHQQTSGSDYILFDLTIFDQKKTKMKKV